MYPYKVKYLESSFLKKNSEWKNVGKLDGISTSKELEALIIEETDNGFELHSITPLTGNIISSPYTLNTTTGFMVTFKKVEN